MALCLLVSCNSNANDETTAPTGAPEVTTPENTRATYTLPPIVTTAKEPKPEDMPNNEMLLVNGVNISSYKIVYNDTPLNEKVGSLTGKTIAEDIGHMLQGEEAACDFDYQSAVRLQQLIWEHYGYEIEIVSDTVAKDPSRYEIIIGATTRLATVRMKMGFVENQYVCALDNVTSNKSQFVICGGSYGATWHAIDKIEELFEANPMDSLKAPLDLTGVNILSGYCDLKTVACIGDSITRGTQAIPERTYANSSSLSEQFGATARDIYLEQYFSYPATLQRELWKDYLVYNYGQGWSSMRDYYPNAADSGPYFYSDTRKFKEDCLGLSNDENFEFDAVLIMLGTNDSSRMNTNWDETTIADYNAQAKSLMDKILEGSPNAQFVLMNVPHRCDGDSENTGDTMMRNIQKDLAVSLKAEGYNIFHYDMEAFNIENMGTGCGSNKTDELKAHENYYNILTQAGGPDTTHPNYVGYGIIANGMIDLLDYILEGGEAPKYMINIG